MVAEEPSGLTFLDDVGATYAQVSYVIRFGGPPDGKALVFVGDLWESILRGTIKGGVLLQIHVYCDKCISYHIDLYTTTCIVI